jgi:glyoxylase-like metal-dependent hydrolase (beta-lactamase superfamily II)
LKKTKDEKMLSVGNIQLHLINDADTRVDPGGAFGLVPRTLWSRYQPEDEERLVPMRSHCLYLEVAGKKVLIDTGYGTKIDEKNRIIFRLTRPHGGLVEALGRLNVTPEDIDLVIDTHLHSDHCGGNTHYNENGTIVATFPNAEYVVQRREYEDATKPNERTAATYLPMNYEPLFKSGQLRLLDGDTELLPGVQGMVTRGHTPGHMSIIIESGGERAMFVCDMASYAVHFERLGWMTAYDVEPLQTLESKRKWQRWALETNALLFFPHDSQRPAGRLREDEKGKLTLEAVEVTYV